MICGNDLKGDSFRVDEAQFSFEYFFSFTAAFRIIAFMSDHYEGLGVNGLTWVTCGMYSESQLKKEDSCDITMPSWYITGMEGW